MRAKGIKTLYGLPGVHRRISNCRKAFSLPGNGLFRVTNKCRAVERWRRFFEDYIGKAGRVLARQEGTKPISNKLPEKMETGLRESASSMIVYGTSRTRRVVQ